VFGRDQGRAGQDRPPRRPQRTGGRPARRPEPEGPDRGRRRGVARAPEAVPDARVPPPRPHPPAGRRPARIPCEPTLSRRQPRPPRAEIHMTRSISVLRTAAAVALVLAAARFGRPGSQGEPDRSAARLELSVVRGDAGRPTPARVYLFKDGKPFR